MKYLLDTDVVNAFLDKDSPFFENVTNKIKNLSEDDELYVSILSLYELEYSLSNAEDVSISAKITEVIQKFKSIFIIISLSDEGAAIYGSLKSRLQKKTGAKPKHVKKHNIDLMIASTALETGCTLVSADQIYTDHLQALHDQLHVANWAS